MSKKTTETKPEKQAVKKQPTELKDEQLDGVRGAAGTPAEALPLAMISLRRG